MKLHSLLALTFFSASAVVACGSDSKKGPVGSAEAGIANQDVCQQQFEDPSSGVTPFHADLMETSSDNMYKVALTSDPPSPGVGDSSTWTLKITDASGNPAPAGTTVKVVCTMTHVGFSHGCASPIKVTEKGGGVYEATPVIFNMQGNWAVDITIGNGSDAQYKLCLQ